MKVILVKENYAGCVNYRLLTDDL